ncbi:MAG: hypothetical protein H6748_19380 [Spirochaetaceae bacterium]|nr:hypothetical protein [Myxococcales bacterium]MCB9726219.1 hypothetical protein [Spirochaetaceae bacterium]
MRRVVVLGAGRPLGARVLAALEALPGVERAIGLESRPGFIPDDGPGIECLPWSPDHRAFAERLRKDEIDTVVDCALVEARTGARARTPGADVIAAMCVGAAVAHDDSPVRGWVVVSSTDYYPASSYRPLLHREEERVGDFATGPAETIAEAEEYVRAIAERKPHVEVAILRLQAIVGAGFRGALAELFSRDRIPVCPGFDPAVQMLHPDDAVAAIVWAAEVGLTGVFNVASSGLLRLGEAVRRAGGRRAVALPFAPPVGRAALRALGLAPVAGELYDLLRHGNAVDAGKLARAGFEARRTQVDCLAARDA